jgi:hypothetical protein
MQLYLTNSTLKSTCADQQQNQVNMYIVDVEQEDVYKPP